MVSGQALAPSAYPGNSSSQSSTVSADFVSRQALAPSADPGNTLSQIQFSTIAANMVLKQHVTSSAYPANLLPQTSTVSRPRLAPLAYPGISFSRFSTIPTNMLPSADVVNSLSKSTTVPTIAASKLARSQSADSRKSLSPSSHIPIATVALSRQLPLPPSAVPRDLPSQPSTSPAVMTSGQALDGSRDWSFASSMVIGPPTGSQIKKPQSTRQAESARALDLTNRGRSGKQLEMECGSVSKEAPTNEEPLHCPECDTADPYPTAQSLKHHMIEMHMGQHRFRCDICGRGFKNPGSVRRHRKQMHTNQPVFRCDACDRGFMFKDHYVGHMNKHNNTPTFKCTYCPQMFIYKPDMYHHRKRCTGHTVIPTVRKRTRGRPKRSLSLPIRTTNVPILPKPSSGETSELRAESPPKLQPKTQP